MILIIQIEHLLIIELKPLISRDPGEICDGKEWERFAGPNSWFRDPQPCWKVPNHMQYRWCISLASANGLKKKSR